MSATLTSLPASPVSTSLPSTSTSSKAPSKSKPVNVFSNDGSFLERFQRSKQEEEDRRKAEEELVKKKQFADRFRNRGKRPPPLDSSPAVTSTDVDPVPTKKPKLDSAPKNSEHKNEARDHANHNPKETATGARPLVT